MLNCHLRWGILIQVNYRFVKKEWKQTFIWIDDLILIVKPRAKESYGFVVAMHIANAQRDHSSAKNVRVAQLENIDVLRTHTLYSPTADLGIYRVSLVAMETHPRPKRSQYHRTSYAKQCSSWVNEKTTVNEMDVRALRCIRADSVYKMATAAADHNDVVEINFKIKYLLAYNIEFFPYVLLLLLLLLSLIAFGIFCISGGVHGSNAMSFPKVGGDNLQFAHPHTRARIAQAHTFGRHTYTNRRIREPHRCAADDDGATTGRTQNIHSTEGNAANCD